MNTFEENSLVNNRYQIKNALGAGGMGTVYAAHDTELNRDVALKVLNSNQLSLPRRVARFTREFEILQKLQHPGIVSVFEQHSTETGVPYFSMELLTDMSLSKFSATYDGTPGVLPYSKAVPLLLDTAKALAYLHDHGFVYCDLKPQNIMTVDGQTESLVKLVDFGIVQDIRLQAESESTTKMIGTTYYMSPEQIREEPLDGRSDIYSFGVLAFELLTGTVPFTGDAAYTITASHLAQEVPPLENYVKGIPSALDRMVHICMEKDLENRYDSMNDIVERLEDIQQSIAKPSTSNRMTQTIKKLFGGTS